MPAAGHYKPGGRANNLLPAKLNRPAYGKEYYYKKGTPLKPNSMRTITTKRPPALPKQTKQWKPKSMKPRTLKTQGNLPEPELFTKVVNGETKYYRKRYIPKKIKRPAPPK